MGALHEGHLSLVRAAQASCDAVAVTIFVNPTQFGPKEDFASYPRTMEQDCQTLEAAGVDLVFAPSVEEMYPAGASTFVEVGGLSERLDWSVASQATFAGWPQWWLSFSTSSSRTTHFSGRRMRPRSPCYAKWCEICGLPSSWTYARRCGSPTGWP